MLFLSHLACLMMREFTHCSALASHLTDGGTQNEPVNMRKVYPSVHLVKSFHFSQLQAVIMSWYDLFNIIHLVFLSCGPFYHSFIHKWAFGYYCSGYICTFICFDLSISTTCQFWGTNCSHSESDFFVRSQRKQSNKSQLLSWKMLRKCCLTAMATELVSKLNRCKRVVTNFFSLRDACVCSVGVTHSHSRLSAVTHHRIIYNSVPKPSGHTNGFPKDNTRVRPHYHKP